MAEQNLPVVGGEYVYKGQNVRVVGTRKIGRGYTVYYSLVSAGDPAPFEAARLADWAKGVQ